MKTSRKSIPSPQLTLSVRGFLANPPLLPGSARARAMTAGSGEKLLGSSKNFIQGGQSLKMFADFLVSSPAWSSNLCLLNWKPLITKSKRLLFQLVQSTPRTEGIESGLWATPNVSGDGRKPKP